MIITAMLTYSVTVWPWVRYRVLQHVLFFLQIPYKKYVWLKWPNHTYTYLTLWSQACYKTKYKHSQRSSCPIKTLNWSRCIKYTISVQDSVLCVDYASKAQRGAGQLHVSLLCFLSHCHEASQSSEPAELWSSEAFPWVEYVEGFGLIIPLQWDTHPKEWQHRREGRKKKEQRKSNLLLVQRHGWHSSEKISRLEPNIFCADCDANGAEKNNE